MTKRNLFLGGGAALLGLGLIALPSSPANSQEPTDAKLARAEQRIAEAQVRLAAQLATEQEKMAERLQDRALQASLRSAVQEAQEQQRQRVEMTPEPGDENTMLVIGDEGASWLGVESQEITSEKAKELKLPAERGVLLERIVPDSPAAKAGLKDNDVITEINGQRVEGAAQFRRMIREIPAGRAVQFTVWRDGRAQSMSVTLGKSEEHGNMWFKTAPRAFSFQLPNIEIPEVAPGPDMDLGGSFGVLAGGRPRLGIDAEDLNGQFGAYFGAPDGEGVLVREVNSASPAEKAGVKSGDVITSLNGERVRSLGDLREKLAGKRDEKTVKLGVLRNKSEVSITVELPPPPSKTPRVVSRRTNI
jgi:C-terminal processing protease CtpA/Prc